MWTNFLVWATNRIALRDEEGQGTVEYALVLAIITVGVVAILNAIGTDVNAIFDAVADEVATVVP